MRQYNIHTVLPDFNQVRQLYTFMKKAENSREFYICGA